MWRHLVLTVTGVRAFQGAYTNTTASSSDFPIDSGGMFEKLEGAIHDRMLRSDNSSYVYRSYTQMRTDIRALVAAHPKLFSLTVGEEAFPDIYGPNYNREADCDGSPCETFIVEIGHKDKLKPETPEIFLSGAVHGNERVGPTVVYYLIELMAERYDNGVSSDINFALRWLMDHRRIIVTPFTNAHGYFKHKREERFIDPNRDFPYMRGPQECMQTITARVVNELFRTHLFRLAITFHGGTKSISYEWGTPNHKILQGDHYISTESPDHVAQISVGHKMLEASGKDPNGHNHYPFGDMTSLVYDVSGGMEDFMYAAGWENSQQPNMAGSATAPITQCNPQTYGGYSPKKTVYDKQNIRTVQYLVEMSHLHTPGEQDLGSKDEFDKPPSNDNKHVVRNLRMALVVAEMADPSIVFTSTPISENSDDVHENNGIETTFYGVGCEKISRSRLVLHSCENFDTSQFANAINEAVPSPHPNYAEHLPDYIVLHAFPDEQKCGGLPIYHDVRDIIHANVALPETLPSAKYCISVVAHFDGHWANQGVVQAHPDPNVGPQSHLARARIKDAYQMSVDHSNINEKKTQVFTVNHEDGFNFTNYNMEKQNAADNADEITAEEERAEQAKLEEAKQREDEEQAALQQKEKEQRQKEEEQKAAAEAAEHAQAENEAQQAAEQAAREAEQAAKELEERKKKEEAAQAAQAEADRATAFYCSTVPLHPLEDEEPSGEIDENALIEDLTNRNVGVEEVGIAVPSHHAHNHDEVEMIWSLCPGDGYHEVMNGLRVKMPANTKLEFTRYGDRTTPGETVATLVMESDGKTVNIQSQSATTVTPVDLVGKGLMLYRQQLPVGFGIAPRLPSQGLPPAGSITGQNKIADSLVCNLRNIGVVFWNNHDPEQVVATGRMCASASAKGPLTLNANCCADPIPVVPSLGYQQVHFRHAQVLMGDLKEAVLSKRSCMCLAGHRLELRDADDKMLEACTLGTLAPEDTELDVKRRYCGQTSQSPFLGLMAVFLFGGIAISFGVVGAWYCFRRGPKTHRRLIEMADITDDEHGQHSPPHIAFDISGSPPRNSRNKSNIIGKKVPLSPTNSSGESLRLENISIKY